MLSREEAWTLLCDWTPTEKLRIHARTVEIVMRDLAGRCQGDIEQWGLAGLLHDADYDRWPEEHPRRIVAWLRDRGEEAVAHAISAHFTQWGVSYDSLLDKALLASDEITGFVYACALIRPDRLETLEPKSVKKRLKSPAFASGVNRAEVAEGLRMLMEEIGGTEDEHLARIIAALKPHAAELGLSPVA
ncbi:MAG: HD domain-containing protein [Acidobacteria bacterium]|nr:HD domain-containing protein [Acidobacteriota bacterium]